MAQGTRWRRLLVAGVALACTGALAGTPAQAQQGQIHSAPGAEVVPGQYIVMLKPDQGAGALVGKHGGTVKRTFRKAINGFTLTATEAQAKRVAADPRVERVEADAIVRGNTTQPLPPWNLDRVDQRSTVLDDNYTYPDSAGAGVTAYIMDTGVRIGHAEFQGRASVGYDAVNDGWNGQDCSTTGHGTHVAGTVGGVTYGVAKKVKLVSVRVLSCENFGTISQIIDGLDWVTANAVHPAVINMSLGAGVRSTIEEAAVKRVFQAGITVVVSAGNDNKDACTYSPAAVPEAITVGASNPVDERALWPEPPPSTIVNGSNWGRCIDLFAPGESIKSAHNATDTATVVLRGTSMASPHVTGAAALLLAESPNLTPAQVTSTLLGRAVDGVLSPRELKDSPNKFLYTGVSAPAVCTITDDTRQPIPDEGTVTRTADVTTCARKVADTARVRVRAEHPFRGDLSVTLVAPNGTERVLRQANGDDATPNLDETYPLTGLSSLDANGAWKLVVKDNFGFDEGALLGWTLTLAEPTVAQPLVTSATYPADGQPHGGVAVAGSFTFKPGSSVPVAKYAYKLDGEAQEREVTAANNEATVTITPASGGHRVLTVRAFNGAGEPSAAVGYDFIVAVQPAPAAPIVSSFDYPAGQSGGGAGLTGVFTFKPGNTDAVTKYVYQLDGGQPSEVAGTGEVSVGIKPSTAGQRTLTVRAANGGVLSAPTTHTFTVAAATDVVDGGTVAIDGSGVSGTVPAGKLLRLKFSGTAGDKLGIGVPTNSVPTFTKLWVADSTGRMVTFDNNSGPAYLAARSGRSTPLPPLPSTGEYQVYLDPDGAGTGDVTVNLARNSTGTTDTVVQGTQFTLTKSGQVAELAFTGEQNTWYDWGISDVPAGGPWQSLDVIDPAGARIGASIVTFPHYAGRFRTSAAGQYRVIVGNYFGEAAVAAKLWLSKEITGDITTADQGKALALARPGQHARLRFDATQGQRLALGYTEHQQVPSAIVNYVMGPDGAVALPRSTSTEATLPALTRTGSHDLIVHLSKGTGSLKIWLSEDASVGALAVGGTAKQGTISRPGQHIRATFDGVAGQRPNLGLAGMTSHFVRLIKPDGTPVGSGDFASTPDSITFEPLPGSGPYEIEVSAGAGAPGTSTLTLSAPADAGTVTIGGAAKAIAVTRAGQDGQVSFTGATGDRLRLSFSGSTFTPSKSFYLTVHKPDGTRLVDRVFRSNQDPYDLVTLPAAGTYVVSLDPVSAATGTINAGLTRVP
jgi:subtilisin-like proprotein convertase family protein